MHALAPLTAPNNLTAHTSSQVLNASKALTALTALAALTALTARTALTALQTFKQAVDII
eukprot:3017112-Alexandrium_andersonii.AAC.1